jgi:hypothetical protein
VRGRHRPQAPVRDQQQDCAALLRRGIGPTHSDHTSAALEAPRHRGAALADTQHVDIREKTFADEAIKHLDFLKSQCGFTGPDVSRGESPGTTVSVRYYRGGTTIEASLVLWYIGEEYVATTQIADAPDGTERRTKIGSNTAHTGYQMRRALKLQAEAVRAAMHTA